MEYFVSRAEKIHGPTAEGEMRTWLAYGSVRPDDLVRRATEAEWYPARLFPEFTSVLAEPATVTNNWRPRTDGTNANGEACLRDINLVAEDLRATVVSWRLLTGFFYRPLTFWRTAGAVFSSSIYRRSKDANGYLRILPRWVEVPVTVLVLLHAVVWTGAAFWVVPKVKAMAGAMAETTTDAWHEATVVMPQAGTTQK